MRHLYKFDLLRALRSRGEMFWALVFPLIIATMFYLTFGTGSMEVMQAIPVALVKSTNLPFATFLQELDGETLTVSEMTEEEALQALKDGEIEGIFYGRLEPTLTVAGTQIEESILETLLNSYLENQRLVMEIAAENPTGLQASAESLENYGDYVEPVSVNENAVEDDLNYFFALIGMACLFGAFMGMKAATSLRADQSHLAVRRSIAPFGRSSMVLSELLAVFTAQFFNVCILLLYLHFILGISFGSHWFLILPVCVMGSITGVAMGIYVGSLSFGEGPKSGIIVFGSLLMSFLAGMMFGGMKDIVERYCPVLNRINPAALISDAFYSITVYENSQRYGRSLVLLGIITVLFALLAFAKLGRKQYDSI